MAISITVVMAITTSIVALVTGLMTLTKTINENRAIFSRIKKSWSKKSNIVIDEFDGDVKNELYEAVEIYLGKNLSSQKCKIKACKTKKEKNSIKVTLEHNEPVKDFYDGHKFKWIWLQFKCFDHPKDFNSIHKSEVKSFNLTFRKKDYNFVIDTYLPHIMKEANL